MNSNVLYAFPAGRGGLLILLLVFGSVLLDSCQATGSRGETTEYTEQDLREDLAGYAARYSSITSAAADEIADVADSRRVRRSTLVWKLRMIPLVKDYAFRDDPQEAYVEVLNLAVATRRYLTEGDGREIFGEHNAIAVQAAEELETLAVEIGQRFLGAERADRLREELEVMVAKNPIRGREFSVEAVQTALAKVESGDSFGWVVSVPMSPFRAFEGVGSAATAIHEINNTASEFTQVIDQLPKSNRWQIELLLYDIEDRDTVVQSLTAIKQLAESADRVSRAVERLPEDVGKLLSEAQGPLAEVRQAIADARELMKPVSATVQDVGEITQIVAAMQKSAERSDDAPPGRPFDIREYDTTAQSVRGGVSELRGLVGELRELAESGKLDGSLIRAVDETENELAKLVDQVTIRVVLTFLAFFTLLVVVRWLSLRLGSATREDQKSSATGSPS